MKILATYNQYFFLAKKYNIDLPEYQEFQVKKNPEFEKIYEINKEALNFWKYNLKQSKEALNYLSNRKILNEEVENFDLGYAPIGNGLSNFLINKGYTKKQLIQAGLSNNNETNNLYDFFVNRIIFPIKDEYGNIIAFSGRIINDNDKKYAKYLNSKETIVFKKNKAIYNVYNAVKNFNKNQTTYLVEGYMDVISLSKVGINSAIALMGTNFNSDLIKTLKSKFNHITVIPDNDLAGITSALKIVDFFKSENLSYSINILPKDYKDIDEYLNSDFDRDFFIKNNNLEIELFFNFLLKKYNRNSLKDFEIILSEIKNKAKQLNNLILANKFLEKAAKELNVNFSDLKINKEYEEKEVKLDYIPSIETDLDTIQLNKDLNHEIDKWEKAIELVIFYLVEFSFQKENLIEIVVQSNLNTNNEKIEKIVSLLKKNVVSNKQDFLDHLNKNYKDLYNYCLNILNKYDFLQYNEKVFKDAINTSVTLMKRDYCLNLRKQIKKEFKSSVKINNQKLEKFINDYIDHSCSVILKKDFY